MGTKERRVPLNKHVQQSRPLPQRPRRERPVARVVLFLLPPHARLNVQQGTRSLGLLVRRPLFAMPLVNGQLHRLAYPPRVRLHIARATLQRQEPPLEVLVRPVVARTRLVVNQGTSRPVSPRVLWGSGTMLRSANLFHAAWAKTANFAKTVALRLGR